MSYYPEPQFMKELHVIREQLSRKWSKMSAQEIRKDIQEGAEKFLEENKLEKIEITPGISKFVPVK